MGNIKHIIQRLYPYGIFCGPAKDPSGNKAVYLTFDDGPIPEVTPQVLAILARYNVKATFFMVGENIDKHPDVYRMVVDGGHCIGNHTYNHLQGWHCSTKEYIDNVQKWEEAANPSPFRHSPFALRLYSVLLTAVQRSVSAALCTGWATDRFIGIY